jgi:hypothetical protein
MIFLNSGCGTLQWLWDAEQRKNQWLKETFFGCNRKCQGNDTVLGDPYDFANPCDCPPDCPPGP